MKKIIYLLVISLLSVMSLQAHEVEYGLKTQESARPYEQKVWRAWNKNRQHAADFSNLEIQLNKQFHQWARLGAANAFSNLVSQTQQVRANQPLSCPKDTVLISISDIQPQAACIHPQVLLQTDEFQNNLLHNAQDLSTLLSIASLFRTVFPTDFSVINQLKNERNMAMETPLISHLSRGEVASFYPLYTHSNLAENVTKLENVRNNSSELVRASSTGIYEEEIKRWATDAAGNTIGTLVERSPNSAEREHLLKFLKEHTSLL